MNGDPHNNSKQESEFQVTFFKKNPVAPKKTSLRQKLGWLWRLIAVLIVLRLFQVTENFWLALAVSMVAVFVFEWRKIADEIDEKVKAHGNKNVVSTVVGTIFIKVIVFAIGISFLFTIAVPLACNFQDSIGIEFFSNRLCENSVINLQYQLRENSIYGNQ